MRKKRIGDKTSEVRANVCLRGNACGRLGMLGREGRARKRTREVCDREFKCVYFWVFIAAFRSCDIAAILRDTVQLQESTGKRARCAIRCGAPATSAAVNERCVNQRPHVCHVKLRADMQRGNANVATAVPSEKTPYGLTIHLG